MRAATCESGAARSSPGLAVEGRRAILKYPKDTCGGMDVTRTFYSEEECLVELRAALGSDAEGTRSVLAEEVAHALLQDMAAPSDGPASHGFEVKLGTWAIRDDELDAFALIKDTVLVHLAVMGGGATGGPWVALAVTTGRLLLALYRKGVRLTPEQALVLTELRRCRDPRVPSEIAATLGSEWNNEKVAAQLEGLATAVSRSGAVKIAERMPDGRWLAYA